MAAVSWNEIIPRKSFNTYRNITCLKKMWWIFSFVNQTSTNQQTNFGHQARGANSGNLVPVVLASLEIQPWGSLMEETHSLTARELSGKTTKEFYRFFVVPGQHRKTRFLYISSLLGRFSTQPSSSTFTKLFRILFIASWFSRTFVIPETQGYIPPDTSDSRFVSARKRGKPEASYPHLYRKANRPTDSLGTAMTFVVPAPETGWCICWVQ